MSALQAIEPLPDGAAIAADLGPAPQLEWIAIARLRVDPAYQRPITKVGRANIAAIAREFRWSRFAPVVVSPIAGGLYAVVDGQHRCTAAATVGIETVPCQVILADRAGQAEAFAAINGRVTRMHRMSVHQAAVAAGDPRACRIAAVAEAAGVTILRYPKPELRQEPGETMAIGAIEAAIKADGEAATIAALSAIRRTKANNIRGGLTAPVVRGASAIAAQILREGGTSDNVRAFFDRIVLIREADKARLAVSRGEAVWSRLHARLALAWTGESTAPGMSA
jgi:hypothetical protein